VEDIDVITLDRFLQKIQTPSLHFAVLRMGNEADALDVLQDTMIGFVKVAEQYEAAAWKNLFYKILLRRIRDVQRKYSWRQKLMQIVSPSSYADDEQRPEIDGIENHHAEPILNAEQLAEAFEVQLAALPPRQQEAYLLRQWQGLSVKQTAEAMQCGEGSVKTHLSRAMNTLKQSLGDWLEDENESE